MFLWERDPSHISVCITRLQINMTISFTSVCAGQHIVTVHTHTHTQLDPSVFTFHIYTLVLTWTWSGVHLRTVQQVNKKVKSNKERPPHVEALGSLM